MATQKNKQKSIPLISWITASVGLLLVLGVIIFLLTKAAAKGPTVPKIHVQASTVFKDAGKHLMIISVTNNGNTTAAALVIEGELKNGTQSVEKSTVTLNYVPAGSTRKAGIYFINDPKNFVLILTPKSFEQP